MIPVKEKKRFIEGGLNLDVEPAFLLENDTTYRKNVCVDEVAGSLVNIKGTKSIGIIGSAINDVIDE